MKEFFRRDHGIVKYVRVGDEYRFCAAEGNHSNLVTEGETPISAGFIYYNNDSGLNIQLSYERSMTLNYLGPADCDDEAIGKILGCCVKTRLEY